jgi:dTDP-glucose pyrophosphorylase
MSTVNLEIKADRTIREALSLIENSTHKIAIVVDENRKIIGSLTDGDVRRGLIAGIALTEKVIEVMNHHPTIAVVGEDLEPYIDALKHNIYGQVIIADRDGKLSNIISLKDLLKIEQDSGIAVIMAGGKGQRLRPLTETIPKPMVEVGGKPILEHLIKQLANQGFKKVILTVNYKKEIIQEYFKDGSDFSINIEYVQEERPLGTAGSLSLLPHWVDKPFIMLNADLVTNVNFFALKHYHENSGNILTVCVREYQHQVPFGVIEVGSDNCITNIIEKPVYSNLVSTGIYAFSPDVLKYIPHNQYLDMPDLISMLKKHTGIGVFSIYESWHDVGRIEDLEVIRNSKSFEPK